MTDKIEGELKDENKNYLELVLGPRRTRSKVRSSHELRLTRA